VRRRERGDALRAGVFGTIAAGVAATIFAIVFWLTWQLLDYEELGDFLIRMGLSWLFLTFLSFISFSAIVTALSTYFLSEDLRLLIAAPIPARALFYSRFTKTAGQASWMIVVFMLPVLLAVGAARCAPPLYYATTILAIVPFVLIPVAFGCVITLLLVNVFPARRARDVLMLMGLLFAVTVVMLLRFMQPERLLNVRSMPDVTAFFASLEAPITPLLPSFWAGEMIFEGLLGRVDVFHAACLWSTALAFTVMARAMYGRFYFRGWSKAQEARKVRFTRLGLLDPILRASPLGPSSRSFVMKDVRVFLRDTTQWSQLLLLVALMLVYLYNFRVLDLDRIPYMAGMVRNAYAFVNLAMAAFVLSAVAARFVFPAVSAEGPAFWLVRTAPVGMRSFLWSKFWIGLVPVLLMAETLTILSNEFLGSLSFLKWLTAGAIFFMSFALVGLAAGMGAVHPRFKAENLTQVAGSYGAVAFMVLAVFYILAMILLLAWPSSIFLWHEFRHIPIPDYRLAIMGACLIAALTLSVVTFLLPMRRGIRALEALEG